MAGKEELTVGDFTGFLRWLDEDGIPFVVIGHNARIGWGLTNVGSDVQDFFVERLDPSRVNVNGGAIALGHPVGMSGNRLALTLLHEMKRRGVEYGAAALCGGGGQGDALLVKALS